MEHIILYPADMTDVTSAVLFCSESKGSSFHTNANP